MTRELLRLLRKGGLGIIVGVAAISAMLAESAWAEEYPERPLQIIVSYGAGGGTDRQTRITARHLEETLGTPVSVQNMPGAGGQVATTALLREPADGYTVLSTNQPDLIMAVVLRNAPFALENFSIVAVDVYDPRLLIVQKDSKFQTFADFVTEAKANPGTLSLSAAAGSAQEMFTRWLLATLGIDVKVVGYKSGGAAGTAMLGGHVTGNMGDDYSRLNLREQTRGLMLGSAKPSGRWPEAELMVDALARYGAEAPSPDFLARYQIYVVRSELKRDHADRFKKLQDAFVAARNLPSYQEHLTKNGYANLSLMARGEEFDEEFGRTKEVLESMADELK